MGCAVKLKLSGYFRFSILSVCLNWFFCGFNWNANKSKVMALEDIDFVESSNLFFLLDLGKWSQQSFYLVGVAIQDGVDYFKAKGLW